MVEHFVTECVPAYYAAKWDTKEACKRELERLSERVRRLTVQLPENETVRGIFLKGGSKTGPQFRCVCVYVCVCVCVCVCPCVCCVPPDDGVSPT